MSRGRALSVMAATVLLAGCGGDSSSPSEKQAAATAAATAAAAATATATEAATTDTASSGGAVKKTPLGTTLKVGQPAIIDYTDSSNHKKSFIELTPTKIEKGSLDDFKNIDLDASQKKSTP